MTWVEGQINNEELFPTSVCTCHLLFPTPLLRFRRTRGSHTFSFIRSLLSTSLLERLLQRAADAHVLPSPASAGCGLNLPTPPPPPAVPFPRSFIASVKVIFKRLFRVYAHIYYSHFEKIVALAAEAHLNTCFKHFIFFVLEFELVDAKELQPLAHLIESFAKRDDDREAASRK